MRTGVRLAAFAATVAVAFAGAYGVGRAVGPANANTPPVGHEMAEHGMEAPAAGHEELPFGGLQVSDHGYTLSVLSQDVRAGAEQDFAFRVTGAGGQPVTSFTPSHDKLMHLIVVRRDLSGFQHLHPSMSPDGTWRTPLTLPDAGQYRVFADFLPGTGGHGLTLGTDIAVAGDYDPKPLPEPAATTTVDGYTVDLAGALKPGQTGRLTLTVRKNGRPVADLERYLAAYGHLVALRTGDLAYLHVHPDEMSTAGPNIPFSVEIPSAGDYRLYLNFQHAGVVRTAEFTLRVQP